MKFFYYFLLSLIGALTFGCKSTNQQELVGKISFLDWKNSVHWNEESYRNYTVDLNKADILASRLDSVNLLYVFASPHCGFCVVEVPRIYKIMEALPRNAEKIQLIAMDEYNTEPTKTYKYYGVNSTPTIVIIMKSNKMIKFSPNYEILNNIIEQIE